MAQGGWNPPPGGYGPPGAPPGGQGGPPGAPPGGYGPPGAPPGGYGPPGAPPGGYGPPGAPGGFAPPQPPQYQAPPASAPMPGSGLSGAITKGFFAGLFDFSFETFVALKVIRVLYGFFLLILALGVLGGFGAAIISIFRGEILAGLGMLIVLPFAAITYLVMGRVYFELIIVAFKIAEDADEIARNTRK